MVVTRVLKLMKYGIHCQFILEPSAVAAKTARSGEQSVCEVTYFIPVILLVL